MDTIKAAANAVLNQGVSLKKAAKEYQVPRTTLRRHLKKGGSIKKQLGRRTGLTEEQETELKAVTLDITVFKRKLKTYYFDKAFD